jgi:hypothetical protein
LIIILNKVKKKGPEGPHSYQVVGAS